MIRVLILTGSLIFGYGALAQETDLDRQMAELEASYRAYETGLTAAHQGDFDTAVREFTRAAEEGLELAQYNLGILYFTGNGVEQDYHLAYHWTRQAAEQGHLGATFNMGVLYFNGLGVGRGHFNVWPLSLFTRDRNWREAAGWYESAAEADHAEAQYNLATMYQAGTGVDQDPVSAHFWAQAARRNEHPRAAELVALLEREMNSQQLSEARSRFAQWVLERE